MKKWIGLFVGVLVLAAILSGAVYFYNENRRLSSAHYAIEKIEDAVTSHDVNAFTTYVDVNNLASDILSEVLGGKETKESSKSNPGEASGFFDQIGSKIGSAFGRKMAELVKPELEKNIRSQILNYVKEGSFGTDIDLSRVYGKSPMLASIFQELGGEHLRYKGVDRIDETGNNATARLRFDQTDLGEIVTLVLSLHKTETGTWKLISIDHLQKEIDRLETKRLKIIEEENSQIQAAMDRVLQVTSIEKSAGATEWGVGKAVMLMAGFKNIGQEEIQSFEAYLKFMSPEGTVLREVEITDTDRLASGQSSQKSWPMTVNPLSPTDRAIYEDAHSNIQLAIQMKKVTFLGGTSLTLRSID